MPLLNDNKSDEDLEFQHRWLEVRRKVKQRFGKRPDINAMLFLIGMNELGQLREEFTKEEKQDLMHIAICRLFESDGFFHFIGRDEDGWPHYEAMEKVPAMKLMEQERLLKEKIIHYMDNQLNL